ncbi:sensor histidine kinase [Glaciibacter sp. 2TAF33]|uniref:sensor histidine kinase n=1 Tax=Glaciibacter sp. 2TAF33 TaxID=3233015 RepID=UPI003F92FBA5
MTGWTILSGVLVVVVIVLLVLWLRAVRQVRRTNFDRTTAERTRIDLELSLAEQQGRLGIIRELQDVAVLSVSRLITRAEGARYTAESDPSTAVRAATALVDDGRGALADMRRVLTIAREGESVATSRPGLPSARDLFRVMRDAGLVVDFVETGERFPLKPGAELAIFRILQASLANTLGHGGVGTEARVSFGWTQDGLKLQIDDDGIRAAARRAEAASSTAGPVDAAGPVSGYTIDDDLAALTESISGAGITQMRERAQLFGGVFNAGTVPGVGFSVSVVFPSLRFHNGVHGVDLARR